MTVHTDARLRAESGRAKIAAACLLLSVLLCSPSLSAVESEPTGQSSPFPRGEVIASVPCTGSPGQSYALFLPPDYTPARRWPILYALDPVARGPLAVELVKEAAADYGYIVAASNNSRNGPVKPRLEAMQAVWNDTHARFPIDPRRVYVTGFSGGARLAAFVALVCDGCIAGVIAQGAGRPLRDDFPPGAKFSYFGTVGNIDFNYDEMVQVADQLDALGLPNRLRVFPGPHQWAPPEVEREALEWMELRAMKEGRRPIDKEFVEHQLEQAASRARALEGSGDLFAAFYEYRKLVEAFEGLADVSSFAAKVSELEVTEAIRKGRVRQQEEGERQEALIAEAREDLKLLALPLALRPLEAVARLRRTIKELKETIQKASRDSEALVEQRALRALFAATYEEGQSWMEGWGGKKEPERARAYFQLVTEIAPDSPMAYFHLARAHAGAGDRKHALRALQRAVDNGFANVELLENTAEFSSLRERKEFREFLARLKPSEPPPASPDRRP